jgi:hypothetical protein
MHEIIEVLLDFGLFILIWMVQLVVYPSFLFYDTKNLIAWHQKYTIRIAILVIPLMFGQLGYSVYNVYVSMDTFSLLKLALVGFVWIFTFAYFAPTHGKIAQGKPSKEMLIRLVQWNWWRTFAWTFICILSIIQNL